MTSAPPLFRRSILIVSTDEDEFNRCCSAASTAINNSGAMCFEHADFAGGIREAELLVEDNPLVAMESSECESYHQESLLMMKMIEKFRSMTSKYKKMSADMQALLWKYMPEHTDEFRAIAGPTYKVQDGLVGNYKAVEMVGHGKFGQIISCLNVRTGKLMILKKMAKAYVNTLGSLKRVACELELLKAASEVPKTLLPIHEMFQTSSHFYYIMDRYGCDVFDFMKVGGHSTEGLSYKNAVIIFRGVCEALAYVHSRGYAHRDVKSENVLIEYDTHEDGSHLVTGVKLIDFGLACNTTDDATRYEACGSKGFMAPEAIVRKVQNPLLLDSWSLGCLGFEIVLGRAWFTEVWFVFFRDIDHSGSDETLQRVDFRPLQNIVDDGFSKCASKGTEYHLLSMLRRMLVLDHTQRAYISEVCADLRGVYDVPGGEFCGMFAEMHTSEPSGRDDGGGRGIEAHGERRSASQRRGLTEDYEQQLQLRTGQGRWASQTTLPAIDVARGQAATEVAQLPLSSRTPARAEDMAPRHDQRPKSVEPHRPTQVAGKTFARGEAETTDSGETDDESDGAGRKGTEGGRQRRGRLVTDISGRDKYEESGGKYRDSRG